MRFAPALREAMSLAKEGKLGELTYFAGELGFPYSTDPASRLFRKPGGGVLLDLGVYPLSFAQALLGKPEKIVSSAALGPTGVDEQFAAILSYKEGAQAVIAASLRAQLRNSAAIHGRNGVLNVGEPLYFPESYRLMGTPAHSLEKKSVGKLAKLRRYPLVRTLADLRNRSRARTVSKHSSQSGYCFEALEVQRCLKAGLLESPGMPLNDTLAVLELMDSIRAEWSR